MDDWVKLVGAIISLVQAITLIFVAFKYNRYIDHRREVYEAETMARKQQREDMQKFQHELITALEALREKAEQ